MTPAPMPDAGRAADPDRGSSSMELAVMAPIVIALVLVVVAFGRLSHGRQLVESAAWSAARSASLAASPVAAGDRAQDAAQAALADAGLSCISMTATVDTTAFHAGGQMTVTVSCTADLSTLAIPGVPGSTTMTETASAPLETYRQYTDGRWPS